MDPTEREELERLLTGLRPQLHRYCARMAGSVIDGEDVVQDAMLKAIEAWPRQGHIENPEGWIFRIAHNTALDHLRRSSRRNAEHVEGDPDMAIDPTADSERQQATRTSLRTFMRLPVAQRSAVILMDVLGYTLEEIGAIMESSLASVKAALHRGRTQLRAIANEPVLSPLPVLTEGERTRLVAYAERFNARDFDAVRDMLAEDVRLELVGLTKLKGKRQVSTYFTNYSKVPSFHFVPGFVDGRLALLVRPSGDSNAHTDYFVLLEWAGPEVVQIRDFFHARYVIEGADLRRVE